MARTVALGIQDFSELIEKNCFYVDKTAFIKEWWESNDNTTLITRPRRFGKTLNMSMLEYFFSIKHADKKALFEGLYIWKKEEYKKLQGTYPVISLSFARVKDTNISDAKKRMKEIIRDTFTANNFLENSDVLSAEEKVYYKNILADRADDVEATSALHRLSDFLCRYYGKKVIILLDEYDTPMQEAYVGGYWNEMVVFTRNLFNSTFKTNPYLERAVMTGITRVSKESVFSDLNHLRVITTTSDMYADSFGFTEEEVFAALDEHGLSKEREKVKYWYDGFVFGKYSEIYNPWSIISFLSERKYSTYWAGTSSNGLISKLLREGNKSIKEKFEELLKGDTIRAAVDEHIVYNNLANSETAVWSLFVASGYLKVLGRQYEDEIDANEPPLYELSITNHETLRMFNGLISQWFGEAQPDYNDFVKALLKGDKKAMNAYMNRVALSTFSYFDTGRRPSYDEPERFYHGFVLGLLVELQNEYIITSNRESGFGRYDVMIEPRKPAEKDAIILEFKVYDEEDEETLKDTVASALKQIEVKQYAASLVARGISAERIRSYGIAFQGKKVLIG